VSLVVGHPFGIGQGKGKRKLGMFALDNLAYQYYNWRSSTANDIIVFTSLVGAFILCVGALNYGVKHVDIFTSVYQVMQLFFQDGFPDPMDMDEVYEVFAIFVATSGEATVATVAVASNPLRVDILSYMVLVLTLRWRVDGAGLVFFTILLAMVEQVFMEVFEANVQKGSRVYETGHVLVLSWMSSALCKNAVARVLREVSPILIRNNSCLYTNPWQPLLSLSLTLSPSLPVIVCEHLLWLFSGSS
jgi:hypothetical protein